MPRSTTRARCAPPLYLSNDYPLFFTTPPDLHRQTILALQLALVPLLESAFFNRVHLRSSIIAWFDMPDFKPKVEVKLDPPKNDPISVEELAKADGQCSVVR